MFMSAPFRRVRLGKESRKGKRGRTFHAFLYGFHRSYSLYDLISEKDMPRDLLLDILFFHQNDVDATQRYVKKSATKQQISPFWSFPQYQ